MNTKVLVVVQNLRFPICMGQNTSIETIFIFLAYIELYLHEGLISNFKLIQLCKNVALAKQEIRPSLLWTQRLENKCEICGIVI
jgi:hypothetical protein